MNHRLVTRCLVLTMLGALVTGVTEAALPPPVPAAREIAEAYCVSHWEEVEAIRFTFDVERAGLHFKRSWTWEPKANRVTCHWKALRFIPRSRTYDRASMHGDDIQVDKWFINDSFWFLFPFHLVWDKDTAITAGASTANKEAGITITYPKSGGGYTPGDAYDVRYDPLNGRILTWAYHKGAAPQPNFVATYEDQEALGPLVVALRHRTLDGKYRVNFSDVAVRLSGHPDWITPSHGK